MIKSNTNKSFIFGFGLCLVLSLFYGPGLRSLSFMLPSILLWFSFVFFAILFQRVLAKKSIAGNVMVIVFKYAILAVSLFLLARARWFSLFDFALGLAAFITSFVLALVFRWAFAAKSKDSFS